MTLLVLRLAVVALFSARRGIRCAPRLGAGQAARRLFGAGGDHPDRARDLWKLGVQRGPVPLRQRMLIRSRSRSWTPGATTSSATATSRTACSGDAMQGATLVLPVQGPVRLIEVQRGGTRRRATENDGSSPLSGCSPAGGHDPGRGRGTTAPVREATPADAVLVVPPTADWVVLRIEARRALVVDVKCFPMAPAEIREWLGRLADTCGIGGFPGEPNWNLINMIRDVAKNRDLALGDAKRIIRQILQKEAGIYGVDFIDDIGGFPKNYMKRKNEIEGYDEKNKKAACWVPGKTNVPVPIARNFDYIDKTPYHGSMKNRKNIRDFDSEPPIEYRRTDKEEREKYKKRHQQDAVDLGLSEVVNRMESIQKTNKNELVKEVAKKIKPNQLEGFIDALRKEVKKTTTKKDSFYKNRLAKIAKRLNVANLFSESEMLSDVVKNI